MEGLKVETRKRRDIMKFTVHHFHLNSEIRLEKENGMLRHSLATLTGEKEFVTDGFG